MAKSETIRTAVKLLRAAATRLETVRRPGWGDVASRLDVRVVGDGVQVHWLLNEDALFVPEGEEEISTEIFRLLGSKSITPWLATLTLEGHQIAANGTIDWQVEPLASAESPFAKLEVFRVGSARTVEGEPYSAGCLAGSDWQDRSVATRLLARMPVLEELSIPEAPKEEAFFHGPTHPLRKLTVFDADFDSFVLRLAETTRFPELEEIVLTESFRSDINPRVPKSHYARLFQSASLPSLRSMTLRQAGLSSQHIILLRGTRIGKQLCRFTVIPVKKWCDRPLAKAAPESGRIQQLCDGPRPEPRILPSWRSVHVVGIGERIQETGDHSPMPILADALEEAGCDDVELLFHCREGHPHHRGCYVIESLLGVPSRKED